MSLSPIELEILETMLLNGKPMNAIQIDSETAKESSSTMMHLTELTRAGYVNSSQEKLYVLTVEGKKVLGIPPITKEKAKSIIAYATHDKAFNFHVETDSTFHIHAHSLFDFVNKLSKVDLKSIEHHTDNGDFETWFECLGDRELAKKAAILRKRKVTGEQLRLLLRDAVEQQCQELLKLTEQ